MAKLVFPSVGAPYRGFVGEVRGWLSRIASYSERQAGAIPSLVAQINVLAVKLGSAVVTTAQTLSLRNYLGSVFTPSIATSVVVTGGAATIRLPSTVIPAQSGVLVPIPAPTGSYVSGITLTIVNGAVTAAVLS